MNNRALLAGAAVLLLAGAGIYLLVSGNTAGEIVELTTQGSEKVLREPFHQPRGETRVLLIGLDGVGDNDLRHAIEAGHLTSLSALLGDPIEGPDVFEHGYAVPGMLSILPSTTLAAWTSIFTGEPPGQTGVPGNEWFDRASATFYAPAPVSVTGTLQAVEIYTESLLNSLVAVPTLYEQAGVRSFISLSQVHRGADLLTMPEISGLGDLIGGFAQGLAGDTEVRQEVYQDLDALAVESLLQTYERHGIPDLQTIYFPGVDLYTHVAEQPIGSQQAYLRDVIDPLLGRIINAYQEADALSDTYILFVSDHGHTPVLQDDLHALGTDGPDEPPAILAQAGFRLRPFQLEIADDQRDFQATVAYQGAFGYVYLADRSRCPRPGDVCDWSAPARFQEDVLPVVRALDEANRRGTGAPELRGTIDLIFAREPKPLTENALPFQVWHGGELVPISEFLATNPRPELLDFEARLQGLATGPHGHKAGDVLLMALSGTDRPIAERYYFSQPYRSWHGSATAEDSRVPLLVIRAGTSGTEIRERVDEVVGETPSQLDITPLVLQLLRDEPI